MPAAHQGHEGVPFVRRRLWRDWFLLALRGARRFDPPTPRLRSPESGGDGKTASTNAVFVVSPRPERILLFPLCQPRVSGIMFHFSRALRARLAFRFVSVAVLCAFAGSVCVDVSTAMRVPARAVQAATTVVQTMPASFCPPRPCPPCAEPPHDVLAAPRAQRAVR